MKTLFGAEPHAGSKMFFTVDMGGLAHGGRVQMPVMALRSAKPGPTLWINGAVHGSETAGSVAAWEIFRELDAASLSGTLIITPVSNALAFQRNEKVSDLDFQDMDSCFPGKSQGTFSERLAHRLYGEIKTWRPDCVVSMHTMGSSWHGSRYTVTKIVGGVEQSVNDKSHALALAYGTENNCYFDLASAAAEWPGATSGTLDIICMRDGIPCFMPEMGMGGMLDPRDVTAAKQGLRNVMIALGMLEGSKVPEKKERRIITRRGFLRSAHAGMLAMRAAPHSIMKKGEAFAHIHYFGEETAACALPEDAFFIGVRRLPAVNEGDPLCLVGYEWHMKSVE